MKKQCFSSPVISKAGRQTGQTRLRSIQRRRAERCGKESSKWHRHVQRGSAAQKENEDGTQELAGDERCIDQTSAGPRAASMPDP